MSKIKTLAVVTLLSGCNEQATQTGGVSAETAIDDGAKFLFGVEQELIETVYLDAIQASPEAFGMEPVDVQHSVEDWRLEAGENGDYIGLVEAQLTAPFECWKFAQLCEFVGPDNAEVLVQEFWDDLSDEVSLTSALASFDTRSQELAEEYEEEYELSEAQTTKFNAMMVEYGFESNSMIFACNGMGSDNRSIDGVGTYVRSKVGRTTLAFGTQAWGNGRYYENYSNVKTTVCVDEGASWKNNDTSTVKVMSDKCKNTKKVTHAKTWPGSPNNLQVQSCATAGPFNDTVCSCRLDTVTL